MSVTITPRSNEKSITVKTQPDSKKNAPSDWWNAGSKSELAEKMLGTVGFLKDLQNSSYRQASIHARLYGNRPLTGYAQASFNTKMQSQAMPLDRPTMNVIGSCIDTLTSRITQSRPRPVFLTDNGNYKARNMAKQMNSFISGEFFQTKTYTLGPMVFRDAAVLGTGVLKVLEDQDKKVALERRIFTELLCDPNDAYYGEPRQMYELKLVERSVLLQKYPKYRASIERAEQAFPDQSSDSRTVADQVMVAEGWHLASGPEAKDGRHVIACSDGILYEEEFTKKTFPFVFFHYSPNMVGFWGQGIAERQMGTQMGINQILVTATRAINLIGVPRVFIEEGSKVVKAHLNNDVGSIVTYRGTKPIYEVAPCLPGEVYEQLQRLIQYAYQQEGISELAANSQKPSGLNSGRAMREFDDIQSDRFALVSKRYDQFFIDLAYAVIDKAVDIAKRDKKYQTVFPHKDGTRQIDLPDCKLLEDPFVIQCFDSSSLPRDPAGRIQTVTEWMQAGIVSPDEGRRLLDFPDLEQVTKLENAAEERILEILDKIIEKGEFTPPDPFMNLALAAKLSTQYYNLYATAKLEEEKAEMLRQFFSQVQTLQAEAAMPPQPAAAPSTPQASPMPAPTNEMIPNVPGLTG